MFTEDDWHPAGQEIDATEAVEVLQEDYDEQAKTWKEPEVVLEGSSFFLDKENEEMTVAPSGKPVSYGRAPLVPVDQADIWHGDIEDDES